MIHLGDITKISGYNVPIPDCVIGGSPCQDLSVAGKRAGLDGERSGLFIEQIRIIKELREAYVRTYGRTDNIRPRYMVWENVTGALSSGTPKGEDFRIVLEETAKIADENAVIPEPPKGKWTNAGCIMGNGWSIAWRIFDNQFWGTPQRRRRIALVADFGGQSAPEILFVRKGVSGDFDESQQAGKRTAADPQGSVGVYDREGDVIGADLYNQCLTGDKAKPLTASATDSDHVPCVVHGFPLGFRPENVRLYEDCATTLCNGTRPGFTNGILYCVDQGGGKSACNVTEDKTPTLTCTHGGEPVVAYSVENHPADSRVDIDGSGKVQTLTSRMGTGGGNVPLVLECYSKSRRAQSDTDYETWKESGVANTLNVFDQGDSRATDLVVAIDRAAYNQGQNAQFDIGVSEDGIAHTLVAKGPGAVCYAIEGNGARPSHKGDGYKESDVMYTLNTVDRHSVAYKQKRKYIVRRLTPLECERLQGYPDYWTDIGEWTDSNWKLRKTSDTARYKALGNSIARPAWKWVIKRISAQYERDATMASLFDGIGGFPLLWEQVNGKGTCLWASEIEEFPIAVTKKRIGGD